MRPKLTVTMFLTACGTAALAPLVPMADEEVVAAAPGATAFPGWPSEFDGRPLTRETILETERRFAERFPGRVGRFTDGRRQFILRWVPHVTREFHPPATCYRALGYSIGHRDVWTDDRGRVWGRFVATKGDETLRVLERIRDRDGREFTDVTSWFWEAHFGTSRGPWWGEVVAEPGPGEEPGADEESGAGDDGRP